MLTVADGAGDAVALRFALMQEELRRKEEELTHMSGRMRSLKDDFTYNLRVIDDRDQELRSVEEDLAVARADLADASSRLNEQVMAAAAAEEKLDVYVRSQREQQSYIAAQLDQAVQEKDLLMKQSKDKELELLSLRQQLHNAAGDQQRSIEALRKQLLIETEDAIRERDRTQRRTEEQTQLQLKAAERKAAEKTNELSMCKETIIHLEARVEELESTVKRKDHTIASLDSQVAEAKRACAAQVAQLEGNKQQMIQAKESSDRAHGAQLFSMAEDLDRKTHEITLLEQKLSGYRATADESLKRAQEEKCTAAVSQQHRLEAAQERIVELQGKNRTLEDDVKRLTVAETELERITAMKEAEIRELQAKVSALNRIVDRRERDIQKVTVEAQWASRDAVERERELVTTQIEGERRTYASKLESALQTRQRLEQSQLVGEVDRLQADLYKKNIESHMGYTQSQPHNPWVSRFSGPQPIASQLPRETAVREKTLGLSPIQSKHDGALISALPQSANDQSALQAEVQSLRQQVDDQRREATDLTSQLISARSEKARTERDMSRLTSELPLARQNTASPSRASPSRASRASQQFSQTATPGRRLGTTTPANMSLTTPRDSPGLQRIREAHSRVDSLRPTAIDISGI